MINYYFLILSNTQNRYSSLELYLFSFSIFIIMESIFTSRFEGIAYTFSFTFVILENIYYLLILYKLTSLSIMSKLVLKVSYKSNQ